VFKVNLQNKKPPFTGQLSNEMITDYLHPLQVQLLPQLQLVQVQSGLPHFCPSF